MRLAIGSIAFAVGVFLCFVVQEFIPRVAAFHGARVVLVPLVFCYAALAMPSVGMLGAAIFAGFLTDLMYLHVVEGQVEIPLGWSIIYFVLFGLIAHGFQPAFLRGHWWVLIPLSAVGTSLFLASQYGMICLRRHGFVFNESTAWRILAPGLMAAVVSPLFHLGVHQAAQFLPEDARPVRRYRMPR